MKQSALDPTAKAISSLHSILKTDPKLQTILDAPTLSDADKSQIIAELEKHTGGQDKSNTVKNFLGALAENNRLSLLEGVCEKFGILMSAARGEIELTITTAQVCIKTIQGSWHRTNEHYRTSTRRQSSVSRQLSPNLHTARARN